MIKNTKQFPGEISEIIDSYFEYYKIILIPNNRFVFHFLYISGVYILYSKKGIFYIGASSNIGQRLKAHFFKSSPYNKNNIRKIAIIRLQDHENPYGIEAELINRFKPVYNKSCWNSWDFPPPQGLNLAEIKNTLEEKLSIK